jgi:hypothetical protein
VAPDQRTSGFTARAGGAKIDALADMLGHSGTDTTGVYARIVDKMTEKPARFLEGFPVPIFGYAGIQYLRISIRTGHFSSSILIL